MRAPEPFLRLSLPIGSDGPGPAFFFLFSSFFFPNRDRLPYIYTPGASLRLVLFRVKAHPPNFEDQRVAARPVCPPHVCDSDSARVPASPPVRMLAHTQTGPPVSAIRPSLVLFSRTLCVRMCAIAIALA